MSHPPDSFNVSCHNISPSTPTPCVPSPGLLDSDVCHIPWLLKFGRTVRTTFKQNVAIAVLAKLLVLVYYLICVCQNLLSANEIRR